MKIKEYKLEYDQSITIMDEGIPLGNGVMGCLIWGGGKRPLRFNIDRYDIWDERPAPETLEPGFTYENLTRLAASGKPEDFAEHERLFNVICQQTTPTKLPAGAIELVFEKEEHNFKSTLDLFEGEAVISGYNGGVNIRSFTECGGALGFIKIEGEILPQVRLSAPDFPKLGLGYDSPYYVPLDYESAKHYAGDGLTGYNTLYFTQKTVKDGEYVLAAAVNKTKGRIEVCYFLNVKAGVGDYLGQTLAAVKEGLKTGYDARFASHKKWWKKFHGNSGINLGDPVLEKQYFIGNYLLGSSAAAPSYPMPLQGLWTVCDDCLPPWKGDYHHDLNTQMTYWSYLKANHLREGKVFVDYLYGLLPAARKFASEFYGTEGALLPSVSTLNGKPIGGWPQYSCNPVNSIWLCQAFDHYYRYSGDASFLRGRAYPYFFETEKAVGGILKEKDGKLYLPLSSSPEVYNGSLQAYQEPNTNNDLALLRYLYITLIDYCKTLGLEYSKYEKTLNKLDEIAVTSDHGVLMTRHKPLPESHRHLGHQMCIYPLDMIRYGDPAGREIIDKTIFHLERLGTGEWVGFSFVWMAAIYSRAYNGEGAYHYLRLFAENFAGPNGFNLNGDFCNRGLTLYHYRPFTLEGNFGFNDALQETLLQNYDGVINAFPSLSERVKKTGAEFFGFLSYNLVEVSAKYADRGVRFVKLKKSGGKTRQKIKNVFDAERLTVTSKDGSYDIIAEKGGIFEIEFSGTVTISPNYGG